MLHAINLFVNRDLSNFLFCKNIIVRVFHSNHTGLKKGLFTLFVLEKKSVSSVNQLYTPTTNYTFRLTDVICPCSNISDDTVA